MKRCWIVVLFCFLIPQTYAQRKADLGIFAGTAYYLGELNESGHFRPLNPSVGIIYRHNFNPRHSLRWNLFYGRVSADAPDLDYLYWREGGSSFSTSLVDMGLQFEFNFMPFESSVRNFQYTTYLSGGAGLSLANKPAGYAYDFVLPFGVGIKLNISKKVGAGICWEFRKTFCDDLDGIINLTDPGYRSLFHNNDWYNFAGITITYKIFNVNSDCPAYWDYYQ